MSVATPRLLAALAPALVISAALCAARSVAQPSGEETGYTVLPLSEGRRVVSQCSRASPRNADFFWTPSAAEIAAAERALAAYLERAGASKPNAPLADYHRQYVGFREDGRVGIYVNLFPRAHEDYMRSMSPEKRPDWHDHAAMICDGGRDFWGAEFDPRTGELDAVEFNGPG